MKILKYVSHVTSTWRDPSWRTRLCASSLLFLAAIGCGRADSNPTERQADVQMLEEFAYPGLSSGSPVNGRLGLIKWPAIVHFLVATDDPADFGIAQAAFKQLRADIPDELKWKVEMDQVADLRAGTFVGSALIYISAHPYRALDGDLRDFFRFLSSSDENAISETEKLESADPPSHVTFKLHSSGEVAGMLLLVKSSLPEDVKRNGIYVGMVQAVSPSLSILSNTQPLFVSEGGAMRLSALGRTFLGIYLSDEVRPGMKPAEFQSILQKTLQTPELK